MNSNLQFLTSAMPGFKNSSEWHEETNLHRKLCSAPVETQSIISTFLPQTNSALPSINAGFDLLEELPFTGKSVIILLTFLC